MNHPGRGALDAIEPSEWPESGIIVPVPEAEPIVQALRLDHDPSARLGVPAHITLLFPFAPPEVALGLGDDLARLFDRFSRFEFSLVDVGRFPAAAFLVPRESAPFVHLTEAIVAQWPEYQPYGGRFPDVIPHLTVADHVGPDVLEEADASLRPQLPIRCHATEAWLICSDQNGRWSRARSFTFK